MVQRFVAVAETSLKSRDYRRVMVSLDQAAQMATGGQFYPHRWNIMKAEALIGLKQFDDANAILT